MPAVIPVHNLFPCDEKERNRREGERERGVLGYIFSSISICGLVSCFTPVPVSIESQSIIFVISIDSCSYKRKVGHREHVEHFPDQVILFHVSHVSSSPVCLSDGMPHAVATPPVMGCNYCSCIANLTGGTFDKKHVTIIPLTPFFTFITDCCEKAEVSSACQKVCIFDVDIDQALETPECFADMDKLMTCAADGSDHRSCCRRRAVPTDCIRWCAGLKVTKPNLCSLSSARDIVSCFDEGKALLPGPPIEVHVKRFAENDRVMIEWDPPTKNAGMLIMLSYLYLYLSDLFVASCHAELVQWYRVFWRPVGSRDLNRNQTNQPFFELQGLDSTKMYEFVVKAGNHHGLSLFTDPLVISMANYKTTGVGNRLLKLLVGVSGLAMIVIAIGAAVAYAYKNDYFPRIGAIRRLTSTAASSSTPPRGVSFENPSYMKDGPVVQFNAPSNVEVNANYKPTMQSQSA